FVFADTERMGTAMDSIVAGGSIISGGRVQRSILGYDVRINSYCEVADSIIYNHVNVGRHSRIRRAIIDRHVTLPERTEIGYDMEADKRRFHVTDSGIVIVVRQESLIEEPETQWPPSRKARVFDGRVARYFTGKQSRSFANSIGPEYRFSISNRV